MKPVITVLCLALLGSFAGSPASAQTDAEYLSAVNFRFANPGARARGLGGAFVALADDATAAVVNPAGLAYLDRSEISIEYAHEEDEYPGPRVETGVLVGPTRLEQAFAPRRPTIESEEDLLSFASWTFPAKRGRFGMALFYATPLDTTAGGSAQELSVMIEGATFPDIEPFSAFRPISSFVTAKNEIFGVSSGLRLGNKFSIGASVGVSRLEFQGIAERGSNFAPGVFNTQTSIVDDESALFVTVGGLWKPSPKVTFGGSWQLQTSYDMANTSAVLGSPTREFSSEFTIPTRWALGVAIHLSKNWTLAAEADRIEYSDLFEVSRDLSFFGEFSDDSNYGFEIPDVTELHLGLEYNLAMGKKANWSFRVGYWRDTTHPPYYSGTTDETFRAWAPRLEEDVDHITFGIGIDADRVIFDVAADTSSDAGTDILGSVVFRLGKGLDS